MDFWVKNRSEMEGFFAGGGGGGGWVWVCLFPLN